MPQHTAESGLDLPVDPRFRWYLCFMPEEHDGPDDSDKFENPPPFFPYREGSAGSGSFKEVDVRGVYAAHGGDHDRELLVVLSCEGQRVMIQIGAYEAKAISSALEAAQSDRPKTHELLLTILDKLEAELMRIVIDDLFNGIYYAKMYFKSGDREVEVDARPSDAIALAVRREVPIFVLEDLLEAEE